MTPEDAERLAHAARERGARDGGDGTKPPLLVDRGDLPATAERVRDVLATRPMLFDRGIPVRLALDGQRGVMVADMMTAHTVTREVHAACAPYAIRRTKDGERQERVTLPERVASLFLDMRGDYGLRPLNGIACAPLLAESGEVLPGDGYDPVRGLWCEQVPKFEVPTRPTRADALAALRRIRLRLRTFPFADAETIEFNGSRVVDVDQPPGDDESAALAALLTAVCRASLDRAPGLLVRGAAISGAGTGKGLLVRTVCAAAFGRAPAAMTAGHDQDELDKRLTAAFMCADSVVFLDNVNSTALRSNVLASVLTERPAHVRPLGRSVTVPLNSAAFVAITGNALSVSEDLARRFLCVSLDAKVEDPEARKFRNDPVADALRDRADILRDVLTIWRWGRQQGAALPHGQPMGSFEEWGRWCRDPLLALGCRDPVERVGAAKADDPQRRAIAEIFAAWWEAHNDNAVTVAGLAPSVTDLIDHHKRGRQFIATRCQQMAGTRCAGFLLTRQRAAGKWGTATYRLTKLDAIGEEGHRDHRGDRDPWPITAPPMPPMAPMPSAPKPAGYNGDGGQWPGIEI